MIEPPVIEQARDEKGKFLPKKPLEFTKEHFWLEVAEVAIAILIANVVWEGMLWLKSSVS